jgi:hypothetical protein
MPNDDDALREQLLALMAAEPMRDYSADLGLCVRIGKFLADQSDKRAEIRFIHAEGR